MDISFANSFATRSACKAPDIWGQGNASGPGTPFADGHGSSLIVECHRFTGYGCGTCDGRGVRTNTGTGKGY